jgi:glycosyltransferase involved in cell wall biosynthesis
MKIIINTAHQRFGGGIQVALSFIYECRKIPNNEYYIWVGPGLSKLLKTDEFPQNFHFYYFDFGVLNLIKSVFIQFKLRKFENLICPDVLISTTGPTYYHSKKKQIIGFNLPNFIYNESPFIKSLNNYRKLRLFFRKKIQLFFYKRDAIAILAQTDDVNDRVKKLLNNLNVFTVSNTCNHYFYEPIEFEPKLISREIKEIRLLTPSRYYAHKNLELIPEVLNRLERNGYQNIKFVLTLSEQEFKQLNIHSQKIVNVGIISPVELPSLYKECDFMFLPTLSECFSAAYAEAMAMKLPIITTNLGFAKSICKDAALFFEPMNPEDATNKIIKLIESEQLKLELTSKGVQVLSQFNSSSERAQKILDICQKYSEDQIN